MRRPVEQGSPGAAIVAEEEALLERVRALLARPTDGEGRLVADYDAELIALRDEVAEAKPEDLAPLVEQMTRIASLAAGRQKGARAPIDAASPYFAHLRLREGDRVRDVLIGRRGLIDRRAGVQIVDWRDAPVSRVYYRYEEGDDYDETVDSAGAAEERPAKHRLVGVVEARRNVSIHGGVLRRIGCPQGTFVRDAAGRWLEGPPAVTPTLEGGQGKAARPPVAGPPKRGRRGAPAPRRLGEGADARPDKHLPEIAALIDRHQFDLITDPSSGLALIQGGAGSGKTTVALHRVAFLTFHDPRRYRPARCLVVVPSPALERYVSGVLPALGVRGVSVTTTRGWMRSTRRRVLPESVDRYCEETPAAVARVKKHPAMLGAIRRRVAEMEGRALAALAALADPAPAAAFAAASGRPPIERLAAARRAAGGDAVLEGAIRRIRRELGDAVGAWAEMLTDGAGLRAALPADGPRAVSDGDIAETVAWSAAQLDAPDEEALEGIEAEARTPVDGGALDESERGRAAGRLDPEDDPLLVRLVQRIHGALRPPGAHEPIELDHVAIDEAQDLSAVEIQVLLDAAAGGAGIAARSVTIAGDAAQRLVLDNGFLGWGELLEDVGAARAGVPLRPLALSYRSTEPVMRFARGVLGPLAPLAGSATATARSGAPVDLHTFDAMGEAVGFLAEALRSLGGREPTASVALIARHPAQADAWWAALARAEVGRLRRVRRQEFSFTPGVDVTDVAQVKGLEFDYVVLLDVTAANYPSTVEARHLLHIGATRAAHQLWLLAVGDPSPLVPGEQLRAAAIE